MALGGGTFTTQDKILPGAYINFVSAKRDTSALSERGIVAMPLALNWGAVGEIITVTKDTYNRHCREVLGYDKDAPEMLPVREMFQHARLLYLYRLGTGASAAANEFATAKFGGTRGNDIKIVIQPNVDNTAKFDVTTLLDNVKIESQTVAAASELADNDFVIWKKDATLKATVGTPLTGGTNIAAITGEDYQAFLDKISTYSFHALGCPTDDDLTKKLFAAFTRRMREEIGAKFQMIGYRMGTQNYEGIISIKNACKGTNEPDYGLVYWLTGAEAGCAVNASRGNMAYDGEYTVDTPYTQTQLEDGILAGDLLFHVVGGEVHVLEDINTFVQPTAQKNKDFGLNQVVRVLDQIANDVAAMFDTRYLDKVQNNAAGRLALWNELVTYHKKLQELGAIENFNSSDIPVPEAVGKRGVSISEAVTPVCAMEQLYMTVTVQ